MKQSPDFNGSFSSDPVLVKLAAADRGFTNHLGMAFVPVPKGTGYLGGGGGKPGTEKFTLTDELYCGVYPVTQGEWRNVMGDNPSHFKDAPDADRCPVETVSYTRIVDEFLPKLNAAEKARNGGRVYRLPTEPEWEYICRGGPISEAESAYHFYCGTPSNDLSGRDANFNANYPAGNAPKLPDLNLKRTCKVGSYKPNKLGIYDLHGNVWQWTSSLSSSRGESSYRVIRGGCWPYKGEYCTASSQLMNEQGNPVNILGFRLLAVPSDR
ncbi:MAG: formylglycine-generating enzyme family protein [Gemmataceae bacterium]